MQSTFSERPRSLKQTMNQILKIDKRQSMKCYYSTERRVKMWLRDGYAIVD